MISKYDFKIYLLGFLVGLVNGLVGSFAGAMSIIVLNKFFYKSQKVAQASTLAYLWILCIVSIIFFDSNVELDLNKTFFILIFGIIGSFIGTKLLNKLKGRTLKIIFAIIMITTGLVMII